MTINQLAQILIREESERQGDPNFVTMVENWINSAIKVIAIQSNWQFFRKEYLFNTFVGTVFPDHGIYTLPKDAKRVQYVRITSLDKRVTYRSASALARERYDLDQFGEPKFWWYGDDRVDADGDARKSIVFTPIPTAVVEIEAPYYYSPQTLASAAHIPLSDEFFEPISSYVRGKMKRSTEKDYAGANIEMRDFKETLSALIATYRTQPAEENGNMETDLPRDRRVGRLRYAWE